MSTGAALITLIGRILLGIFPAYVSGYLFHIRNPEMAEGYAQAMGFPLPRLAGVPAGLWLVVSSVSIAAGIWPDIGALMLAFFMIPTAWYFHAFWKIAEPEQRQAQTMFFWRNVMVIAACLIAFGFFTTVGDALRFAVTGPAIDLQP